MLVHCSFFRNLRLEGIRRYCGQVLAGWRETAQQPILIERTSSIARPGFVAGVLMLLVVENSKMIAEDAE